MPEIRLQHRSNPYPGGMNIDELAEFIDFLQHQCARRFSLDDFPLTPHDFNVYDDILQGMSRQAQDIVVRISLHHFETRLLTAQSDAEELEALCREFLNTLHKVEMYGLRTVGVSLLYAEIAWAETRL